jgi:hypothetical protein
MSEDVHPAVCSGAGIAEDEHKVWCGDVLPGGDIPGIKVRTITLGCFEIAVSVIVVRRV